MPAPSKVNDRGVRRLKKLRDQLKRLGNSRCEVTPTLIVYELCQMRGGRRLLEQIPPEVAAQVRARWKPKVKRACQYATKEKQVKESMIRKAWRYGAYLYVDALWQAVAKRGVWGRVKDSTIPVKGRDLMAARGFAAEHRAVRAGREVREARSVSLRGAEHITHFGVRSRERDRRWYDIQKGKRKVGMRDDRREPTDPISVYIGERKIG